MAIEKHIPCLSKVNYTHHIHFYIPHSGFLQESTKQPRKENLHYRNACTCGEQCNAESVAES